LAVVVKRDRLANKSSTHPMHSRGLCVCVKLKAHTGALACCEHRPCERVVARQGVLIAANQCIVAVDDRHRRSGECASKHSGSHAMTTARVATVDEHIEGPSRVRDSVEREARGAIARPANWTVGCEECVDLCHATQTIQPNHDERVRLSCSNTLHHQECVVGEELHPVWLEAVIRQRGLHRCDTPILRVHNGDESNRRHAVRGTQHVQDVVLVVVDWQRWCTHRDWHHTEVGSQCPGDRGEVESEHAVRCVCDVQKPTSDVDVHVLRLHERTG
jgi:hypothetical protein